MVRRAINKVKWQETYDAGWRAASMYKREDSCPHSQIDLALRCAWLAGYRDKVRERRARR